MTPLAAAVAELIALGVTGDALVAAIGRMEQSMYVDRMEHRRSAAAERQARYMDRKRHKASQSVTNDVSDVISVSDSLSLPLSPQTPQTPTHTHGDINTRTREAPQVVAIDGELLDPAEPEKPVVRDKRGTRLPDDWQPTPSDLRFAAQQGLTPEETNRVAENFRDYWIAKPGAAGRKLDWPATWRNSVRSHVQRGQGARMASRPAFGSGGGQGPSDFAEIVARRRGYTTA